MYNSGSLNIEACLGMDKSTVRVRTSVLIYF